MILIADSGSTKTDWALVEGEQVSFFHSEGLNPIFRTADEITNVANGLLEDEKQTVVSKVHFYGASCSTPERNKKVHTSLQKAFPKASIEVEHDLLAAARAVFHHSEGIACILGTGSNSCVYNGTQITDNITSLGYLLGDEGGGYNLGKSVIQAYVYREFSTELETAFENTYAYTRKELAAEIYSQALPNAFIAGFAKFCFQHRQHEQIRSILQDNFKLFLTRHVSKYDGYKKLPVGFVGSIAAIFEEELSKALTELGMQKGPIIKQPIEELCKFHSN